MLSVLSYLNHFYEFHKYVEPEGIRFTCFIDDLTFSSEKFISKTFKRIVYRIIQNYRLDVNHSKTRHRTFNKEINVTGAIVKDGEKFIPNKLQKKLYFTYVELDEIELVTRKLLLMLKKVSPDVTFGLTFFRDDRTVHASRCYC